MAGPLLSASWYRVADLKPRLRTHARMQRHRYRGQVWFVLQDPASGRAHRFTPAARLIINGMDGTRSVGQLWEIANLALPLAAILVAQVAFVAAVALLTVPRLMGRDYDAAVMASGFVGFMLGTTANAMANMGVLVEKYGPAPRAYLVVPMVGAFFIDFTNALIITAFLNLLK